VIFLFGLATLMASALSFWVEPLVGRALLPLLGGAPAVWNGCMVFFQASLLAGYALAHAVAKLPPAARLAAHAAVLLAPLAALPIGLAPAAVARLEAGAAPLPWLFGALAGTVGLPFLALSTTAPLLQSWAAKSRHPALADPYPLYAVSNAGSLLGLLAYPFLLEPRVTTAAQMRAWSHGYLLLAGLALAAAAGAARWARPEVPDDTSPPASDPVDGSRKMEWIALSLVPSSLLLGVTAHITSDIAAMPLLWIIPLTIYLLTFVAAFARRPPVTVAALDRVVPVLVVLLVTTMIFASTQILFLPLHLVCFAVLALSCHLRLAEARPAPAHLTEYYLWISLGGVLGGMFNALVAPLLFDRQAEYPLALVAACFLRPPPADGDSRGGDGWFAIVLGALCANLYFVGAMVGAEMRELVLRFAWLVPLFVSYRQGPKRTRFALAIATLLVTAELHRQMGDQVLYRERTFFGVHRVVREVEARRHRLVHGGITHGLQLMDQRGMLLPEPMTYYHRDGPAGDVFRAAQKRKAALRVALVGLGAGSLASFARPTDELTFHEIDAAVVRIARDPRYFTYVSRSPAARIDFVVGDARLTLKAAAPARYDLIMLDAFSSDAVPVHLLTREALALYLEKLAPGGMIAVHISNLYLDMRPLIGALGADARLAGASRKDREFSADEEKRGRAVCTWTVLVRTPADLAGVVAAGKWEPLPRREDVPAWTDDCASVVPLLEVW
jgi:hypothetical protein